MGGRFTRILAATALALALLALLALWLERRPIARDAIDRELARRHVRARYVVAAIGPHTQRLEHVVIGDPADPDLVADSATVLLGWGLTGPSVRTIAASGVRLHGRVTAAGTLSLGEIDALLPPPSNAPFALPDLNLALADTRMRLDTPAGPVALSLQGSGNLQDGFSGHLGAAASQLQRGRCRLDQPTLFAAVSIRNREPLIDGPLRAASLQCPDKGLDATALWIALKLRLGAALDRWTGNVGAAIGGLALGDNRLAAIRGTFAFAGDRRHTEGDVALATGAVTSAGANARAAHLEGRVAIDGGTAYGFRGRLALQGASLAPDRLDPLARVTTAGTATPIGPILTAWAGALRRASTATDLVADVSASTGQDGGVLALTALNAQSTSGAHLALASDEGVRIGWGAQVAPSPFDASAQLGGDGLPALRLHLARVEAGAPIGGELRIATYAAGRARLAATPVSLAIAGGVLRATGTLSLDGPLANGRIAGLALPLALRVARSGALLLDPACVRLRFDALEISGARIGGSAMPLCPSDGALVRRDGAGRLSGGGRLVAPQLIGAMGESPLRLAARGIGFDVARGTFAADALSVTLGAGAAPTTLAIGSLTGAAQPNGIGGRFVGAGGRIGRVPLLLNEARGRWMLGNGKLALDGALQVADTAAPARFHPLVSRNTHLVLDGGHIRATGTLLEPRSGRRVAEVTLAHDLASGVGHATLDVASLVFDGGLQPEALTPLTLGIVADVKGSVHGVGHIDWNTKGVTSDGQFSTDDLALAAAFGQVSGITGTIRFSDLLGLATPPHQEVVLGQVNPGIAVFGGHVRYQLLPGEQVRVESGTWPLAGGTLSLEPSLLDFGRPTARRFSFIVTGLDAGQFIEQFKLDDVAATGTFDGVLPMVFDDKGGKIVGGRLVARAPGGRLSYVGEVSNAQLGTYGKLAFDALKSIHYQALALDLDGAIDGEVVSRISFTGVNDRPATVAPAKGLTRQFSNLPFKFNITVRAPFRGLLNSATAFADPGSLLSQESVQPQESGAVPIKP